MGQGNNRPPMAQQPASLVHQPFRALNQISKATGPRSAPQKAIDSAPATPAVAAASTPADGATLFLDAVADVTPLEARARERVQTPAPAAAPRAVTDPDAEALAELCDLVTGAAPFDLTDSDEYIEGAAVGVDPRLLRRLRSGEFAYQAHIDLHGMSSEQARQAVTAFLTRAYLDGKRCVLIVHGRGRNSKDQVPVLKRSLTSWLARGQWARCVLAFTSARPCDGGTGALYVLLRRDRRRKHPMWVTEGGKR